MMFIEIDATSYDRARFIRVADIETVERREDEWTVTTAKGAKHLVGEDDARKLLAPSFITVPAASSDITAYVFTMNEDAEREVFVEATHVVAWRLEDGMDATAILQCTGNDFCNNRMEAISTPDGRWYVTHSEVSYDTLDEVRAYFVAYTNALYDGKARKVKAGNENR